MRAWHVDNTLNLFDLMERYPTRQSAIDCLPHFCHIVNIRCNSYRMRAHQDLLRCRVEEDRTREDSACLGA